MEIRALYPMSQLTTFQIGGPADFFAAPKSLDELREALSWAREKSQPVLVLGRGSNVLVSDRGFRGLVIQNNIPGLTIDDVGLMTVGAGEDWDQVVAKTVEKNLAGIENLSGVPGSAGGAVVQNIGAYGQTLADRVVRVWAIEAATGQEKAFSPAECEFVYRGSWFKANLNQYIVTSFQLQLTPGGAPLLTYAHVQKHFENKPTPTLAEVRQFIIKLRASKGYVIMPGIESFATAGSFFKNPVVSQEQYEQLKPMLGDKSLNRFWPASTGVKIAAAYLMQEAGFGKGYQEGPAGISPKHSLSLVNFGGAHASDIKALADKIQAAVLKKFGVRLEPEVLFIGEF